MPPFPYALYGEHILNKKERLMRRLPQPKTTAELIAVAHSYGINTSTWLKPPEILLGDIVRKDVVLAETKHGLSTIRYSGCLEAYHVHLGWPINLSILHEDHQEVPQPDGSMLIVPRNLPFLQETWQFESAEDIIEALKRAALSEGGLTVFDPSRARRRSGPLELVGEWSKFFLGVWSQRLRQIWEYPVFEGEFNPEGNRECDDNGVVTVSKWRSVLQQGTSPA